MTLRSDLAVLLAEAGIPDVNVEEAVEDEHVRLRLYHQIIEVGASRDRDNDRRLAAVILRDPSESVAKTAVVKLVDSIALQTGDPAEFQRWAAGILSETRALGVAGHRGFVRGRIRDWTIYLAVNAGQTPTAEELTSATSWMQRQIAERSTSLPILTVLAENANARKTKNIARSRADAMMRKAERHPEHPAPNG